MQRYKRIMTESVYDQFQLPARSPFKTMWSAQSSESSHFQSRTAPLTSDRIIQPETAPPWLESRRPYVAEEVDDDSTECHGGISTHWSWFHAHNDTDLFSDTKQLAAHRDHVDKSLINDDAPCYQHYDVDASSACSVEKWLQGQLSGTPSCENLQTWSTAEQYFHQQHPHQQASLAKWHKAASQTAKVTDKQSSQATTSQRSRAALTLEELYSGAAPCPLAYKGRRLRHIAPKPTTGTIADTTTHQSIPHHPSLPKTIVSVIIASPSPTATTTAVIPDNVDEQPSPTGKTDFTCPICVLELN